MTSNHSFPFGPYQFDILQITDTPFKASVPEHSHGNDSYEVHYITSGYGILISNGQRYELSPGILYITGPNVSHAQLISKQSPMLEISVFYKVNLLSNKHDLERAAYKLEKSLASSFLSQPFWIGHDKQNLQPLFTNLISEMHSRKADSNLMISSYLKQLLILIVRNYEDSKEMLSFTSHLDLNKQRSLIIDQAFLDYYKTITLEHLAEKIGLGIRQTQRLLLEEYGMNFSQKRLQARMAQAKLLLESTEYSISDIAEMVGYGTSEHFCNVFKKANGITAGEYRKE